MLSEVMCTDSVNYCTLDVTTSPLSKNIQHYHRDMADEYL
jgi:hypothetical protein